MSLKTAAGNRPEPLVRRNQGISNNERASPCVPKTLCNRVSWLVSASNQRSALASGYSWAKTC